MTEEKCPKCRRTLEGNWVKVCANCLADSGEEQRSRLAAAEERAKKAVMDFAEWLERRGYLCAAKQVAQGKAMMTPIEILVVEFHAEAAARHLSEKEKRSGGRGE